MTPGIGGRASKTRVRPEATVGIYSAVRSAIIRLSTVQHRTLIETTFTAGMEMNVTSRNRQFQSILTEKSV